MHKTLSWTAKIKVKIMVSIPSRLIELCSRLFYICSGYAKVAQWTDNLPTESHEKKFSLQLCLAFCTKNTVVSIVLLRHEPHRGGKSTGLIPLRYAHIRIHTGMR